MRIRFNWGRAALAVFAGLLVAEFVVTGAAQAAPAPLLPQCRAVISPVSVPSGPRASAQVAHDARTNATFFFSATADGGVRLLVKAGELEAEKVVYADGHFLIEARTGNDTVSVAVAPNSVDIERQKHKTHLDPGRAADEDWLHVSELVAGSRALRLFRMLTASLEPATLETPAGAAMLLGDAVLGTVAGDVGAVGRLASRMHTAFRSRIRPVAIRQGFLDCYRKYEAAADAAWEERKWCAFWMYMYDPSGLLCTFGWVLQVESAWFQFIVCSGFPFAVE